MTTPELFKLKLRSNEHFAHGAIYHGCIIAAQESQWVEEGGVRRSSLQRASCEHISH